MNKGFITLMTVLVVSAVGLSIALSLVLLGLGSSRTSFALAQSAKARGLANACIEESMRRVKNSLVFSGTSTLTLSEGTCTYEVTAGTGQLRTVSATGTAGTIIRKVRVDVTRITPTILYTWQEIQ